ncbi:hypothetical protein JTE90_000102 [Oedothorax gibbosus]|uniref:Reverse transcriptase/retrotransposon-derived protein RNase H-like domain-containing protein n=1 Tax=Oedothorax gibbosus TaxID=931172 RepID=A0AAV6THN7_9ARAC|nr:hypothetical protein JTE90_000102 [Oedothorax gibbosus]
MPVKKGIGAVLSQEVDKRSVISYFSKSLSKPEREILRHEKRLLASQSRRTFHPYFYGGRFPRKNGYASLNMDWICRAGCPFLLHPNQGKEFTSAVFTGYGSGVKKTLGRTIPSSAADGDGGKTEKNDFEHHPLLTQSKIGTRSCPIFLAYRSEL